MSLDEIVSLAKRRGFVFPTSEIYGGLANSYDYGPLGADLLRNIRNSWWNFFIEQRSDMVGLDSQIMLHPQTWVASGHVASFTDPMVEDVVSHKRYRADHLIEKWLESDKNRKKAGEVIVENMKMDDMAAFIKEHKILSPDGNSLSDPKAFNLLFETQIGAVSGEKSTVYLRGETAQGIFTNFKNILDSTRLTLPFGVGQVGKSFRNEVTTGQFVFRTLEFEQAEIEYFFDPSKSDWHELMEMWKKAMWEFVTKNLGIKEENLRWRAHTDKERSHYSKETFDLEYHFPFGWKELWGIAYRADYDLQQHLQHTGKNLEYVDPYSGAKIVPHVIEPAVGINRLFLMILCDAYRVEEDRTYLQLAKQMVPYKVAVFPLVANKEDLVKKARDIFDTLKTSYRTYWDDRGNIGKRYRYQDEMGTPLCVTVDYQTLEDQTVTVRNRDTMKQERVHIDALTNFLNEYYG